MSRTLIVLALASGCTDYNLGGELDPNGLTGGDTDVVAEPSGPEITVEPMSVDFGYLPKDCASDPQTVTVRNDGDQALEVSSIALVDDEDGSFTLDGSGGTLAPGDELTFEVAFEPADWEEYGLPVRIVSNDLDEGKLDVDLIGVGSEDAIHEEVFEQESADAVDVLWVVDNSGSMSDKVDQLGASFTVFMDSFVELGLDFQIGVVTTDMIDTSQSGKLQGSTRIITPETADPVGAFLESTDLGSGGSADEVGFAASKAALTDPLVTGYNAGFLREDANLAVIVLSDEDEASDISATSYASWLQSLKADPGMASLSAIVGRKGTSILDPGGCVDLWTGASAVAGTKYVDAADLTGGIWEDICQLDFDPVVQHLSYAAAGLLRTFELAFEPSSIGDIEVTVDGVEVDYSAVDGWTWLEDENAVQFNGDSVPPPGSTVVIAYAIPAECPS